MKAINYIYNNLNCLNRPILAQYLEKENVELTDEIWDYLRETSWNTNPVFLRQFGIDIERSSEEGGEEEIATATLCFKSRYCNDETFFEEKVDENRSTIKTLSDLWNWCMNHNTKTAVKRENDDLYNITWTADDIEIIYVNQNNEDVEIGPPKQVSNGAATSDIPIGSQWYISEGLERDDYFNFTETTFSWGYDN